MNRWAQDLSEDSSSCLIECTVVSGFENLAKEECFKKLGAKAAFSRGRIVFEMPMDQVSKVLNLKSVDNVYVVIHHTPSFGFSPDKEACLAKLNTIIDNCQWDKGLGVWQKLTGNTDLSVEDITKGKLVKGAPPTVDSSHSETELGATSTPAATGLQTPDLLRDFSFAKLDATDDKVPEPADNGNKPQTIDSGSVHALLSENLQTTDDTSGEETENSPPEHVDIPEQSVDDASPAALETGAEADSSIGQMGGNAEAQLPPSSEDSQPKLPHQNFKFRVTCHRSGGEHSFGSPEAASHFGAAVQTHFSWKPDMTQFDLEVVLRIVTNQVHVSLSLTRESLHKRDITCFGKTTLRSTIAYNMLQLARICDGDVVCDPMCGTGVIPLEGAVSWANATHLCGDIDPVALEKTSQNVVNYNEVVASEGNKSGDPLCLDIFRWDTTCLPLKTSSVDVFVTDLPFGKRSGKKLDNRKLYPAVLFEMARTANLTKGRAVILTHDRRAIIKALQTVSRYWKTGQMLTINIGGLDASVYYLERRNNAVYQSVSNC